MPDKKEIKWDDWGIQATMDGIPHQLHPAYCPHCNCKDSEFGEGDIFYDYIVGFSSDYNRATMECPKCFKRFWRHVNDDMIEIFTINTIKQPEFFKVPDALKELLEMLKKQKKK